MDTAESISQVRQAIHNAESVYAESVANLVSPINSYLDDAALAYLDATSEIKRQQRRKRNATKVTRSQWPIIPTPTVSSNPCDGAPPGTPIVDPATGITTICIEPPEPPDEPPAPLPAPPGGNGPDTTPGGGGDTTPGGGGDGGEAGCATKMCGGRACAWGTVIILDGKPFVEVRLPSGTEYWPTIGYPGGFSACWCEPGLAGLAELCDPMGEPGEPTPSEGDECCPPVVCPAPVVTCPEPPEPPESTCKKPQYTDPYPWIACLEDAPLEPVAVDELDEDFGVPIIKCVSYPLMCE